MTAFMNFISENTVAVLAVLCIPVSGIFLIAQRKQLKLDTRWKVILAPFLYVVVGLLSLVVFSVFHDIRTFPHWSIHHQGLLIVFPLFFPLIARWLKANLTDVSDAVSVLLPGIIAVIRIYCLIRGCDYGRCILETHVRWPIREGVIVLNFICCIAFFRWNRYGHPNGKIFPAYLIIYGLYRIVEVRLRYYDLTSSEDYFFAVLSIVVGSFIFIWADEKNRRQVKRVKKGGKP